MTLEEAIKHEEEVAVWHETEANKFESDGYEGYEQSQYLECADEHRQLAKWLKELKAHREAWNKMQEEIEKINADNNSYSVKNNACLIVSMYKPKGEDRLNYNTKQCTECGFNLPLYSKFCMNCGAFIEGGDTE